MSPLLLQLPKRMAQQATDNLEFLMQLLSVCGAATKFQSLRRMPVRNIDCNWAQQEDQSTRTTFVFVFEASNITLRLSDPKQAHYAQEAREFLRKKLIGKHVKVNIDFVRPREGDFEERECATILYGGQNAWVY